MQLFLLTCIMYEIEFLISNHYSLIHEVANSYGVLSSTTLSSSLIQSLMDLMSFWQLNLPCTKQQPLDTLKGHT